MALKCVAIALAEYTSISADGKTTIAGIVDTVQFAFTPGTQAEAAVKAIGVFAPLSLFVILTASIADGLQHPFGLSIQHEDGQNIISNANVGTVEFKVNRRGRPLRAHLVVELRALQLPAAGDYDVIFSISGVELARTPLYVDGPDDT